MNAFVYIWLRSGQNPNCLFPGSKEEITTELKSWVKRRRTFNNITMAACWDAFTNTDFHQPIKALQESLHEKQDPEVLDQLANLVALRMKICIHFTKLEREKARENHLADYLLASLHNQGVRWPDVLWGKGREAEASVCACLGIMDQGFDIETELETLMDKVMAIRWINEYSKRKGYIGTYDVAEGSESGWKSYPAATYTADLFDDTDVAASETDSDTENDVVYIADMLGNITTDPRPSSNNTPDTPKIPDNAAGSSSKFSNDTQNAAGPSSSTTPNAAETEGGDETGKKSKARKKREQKQRAKARAKEAAANAQDIVGNNDDDDDGDSSSTATITRVEAPNAAETEGGDEVGTMSKAKKKRQRQKRAKARAKEAAASAEDVVGNDDDDDDEDEEWSALVPLC